MSVPTDETLVIETPERVPLHFALASIGNRFLACAFDHGLQLLAIILIIIVLVWVGNAASLFEEIKSAPKWVWALLIFAVWFIWSGYFVLFEWAWRGQTPGKRWLHLWADRHARPRLRPRRP